MLASLLLGLFVAGLVYGVGGIIASQTTYQSIPKTRFGGTAGQNAVMAAQNQRVFEGLKRLARRDKIDYSEFDKDSMVRDLYWAGVRSTAAIQIIPLVMNLIAAAPLMVIGIFWIIDPLSMNMMGLVILGGAAGYYVLRKTIVKKKLERQGAIEKDLPQFLDLLVVCVEAGQNFTSAIQTLIQELDPKRPLIEEFTVLNQEYLGGMAMAEACGRFTQRCGVENLSAVIGNIVQSEKIGTSLGQTLRILAREMRDKRKARLKEAANQMAVKALFPTMFIMLALMIVLLGPAMLEINKVMGGL